MQRALSLENAATPILPSLHGSLSTHEVTENLSRICTCTVAATTWHAHIAFNVRNGAHGPRDRNFEMHRNAKFQSNDHFNHVPPRREQQLENRQWPTRFKAMAALMPPPAASPLPGNQARPIQSPGPSHSWPRIRSCCIQGWCLT